MGDYSCFPVLVSTNEILCLQVLFTLILYTLKVVKFNRTGNSFKQWIPWHQLVQKTNTVDHSYYRHDAVRGAGRASVKVITKCI